MKLWALLLFANLAHGAAFVLQRPKEELSARTDWVVGPSIVSRTVCSRSIDIFPGTKYKSAALYASSKDRKKGVYTRPSAAIERGSGFFVPGLEGPRVRLLFGLVVLALTYVNHLTSPNGDSGVTFSEGLAVVYSCLLLLQAAIEFEKQSREGMGVSLDQKYKKPEAASTSTRDDARLVQRWSADVAPTSDFKEAVQWSAASYIALTPATQMVMLAPDRVIYQLGGTVQNQNDEIIEDGTRAAFETLRKSKGGRVSLPPTHPVVRSLVDDDNGRCVVLQNISGDQQYCWLVSSNQLLAAFTNQDLKWLGQLAAHVSQHTKH